MNELHLPPTQELMMCVLAARYRLGETLWTFRSDMAQTARKLQQAGLVQWKSGVVENTIQVWMTSKGRAEYLSPTYVPPAEVNGPTARARALADAWMTRGAVAHAFARSLTRPDLAAVARSIGDEFKARAAELREVLDDEHDV